MLLALQRVVPHTGDVDRNDKHEVLDMICTIVVPHTGDVDRNFNLLLIDRATTVVPHTGDVDRNTLAGKP